MFVLRDEENLLWNCVLIDITKSFATVIQNLFNMCSNVKSMILQQVQILKIGFSWKWEMKLAAFQISSGEPIYSLHSVEIVNSHNWRIWAIMIPHQLVRKALYNLKLAVGWSSKLIYLLVVLLQGIDEGTCPKVSVTRNAFES